MIGGFRGCSLRPSLYHTFTEHPGVTILHGRPQVHTREAPVCYRRHDIESEGKREHKEWDSGSRGEKSGKTSHRREGLLKYMLEGERLKLSSKPVCESAVIPERSVAPILAIIQSLSWRVVPAVVPPIQTEPSVARTPKSIRGHSCRGQSGAVTRF